MRRPRRPSPNTGSSKIEALSKPAISERVVRSQERWHEFLTFLDRHMQSRWVFRGQPSDTWELKPSAGRSQRYDPLFEERVFRAFKKDARLHLQSQLSESNDWEWLALAQHFGLPTRLLDWTMNPLVACFFALMEEQHADKNAVVYAYPLDESKIIDAASWPSPFKIEQVGFLFPSSLAPRISSQRGIFSVHPQPNNPWSPTELDEHRFVIPAEARFTFQRKLFRMGVDAAHIWANLEGVCISLKWQYDKRIGISAVGI
jgi:FRG domain